MRLLLRPTWLGAISSAIIVLSPAGAAIGPEPMYRVDDAALQSVVIPSQVRDGVAVPDADALTAAIRALQARRQGEADAAPLQPPHPSLFPVAAASGDQPVVMADVEAEAETHSPPAEACPAPARRVAVPVVRRHSVRVIVAVIESGNRPVEAPSEPAPAQPATPGGPTEGPTLAPLSNR